MIFPVAASDVSGPLSYARYDGSGYTITGADAPSLLLEKEILSIDLSNGTTIDADHFYYAGTQKEGKIDYLGNTYTIENINDSVVLYTELWKDQDVNIGTGDMISFSEGYALQCTDISCEKEKATFILTRDQRILDSFSMPEKGSYNYSDINEEKNVVLFSCTAGHFLHENGNDKVSFTDISMRKKEILKDGQDLFEDYILNIEDIDWDGDEDIVVRLKPGNTFTIIPSSETSLLNGYICLKTGIAYNHLLDGFDNSAPVVFNDEYKIYSYKHSDMKHLEEALKGPSPDHIFSEAPYVKFNGIGTIDTNTSSDTTSSIKLRGKHEIYTYVHNETLSLSVSKHDLNWYEGEDELNITVYSPSGQIVGSMRIPDDGQNSAIRNAGNVQTEVLEVPGLRNGIYHIELTSDDDIVIDELCSTQDKLVFDGKMFILSPADIYVGSGKRFSLKFMTLHDEGLQEITIKDNDRTYHTKLDKKNKWVNIKLPPSSSPYRIIIPRGDIKIESDAYFALSKEAFFSKDECTVVPLYDTMSKKQGSSVDYFIVPLQKEQVVFYPYRNTTSDTYFDISNYDNELNTWTSPGLFYFDITGKRSWEFLKIVPGNDNILSKDEMVYGSLQYNDKKTASSLNRTIAYLGEPYCILEIDDSSAIISRLMNDMDIRVNSSRRLELGDGISLEMHTIDPDAQMISLSLHREGNVLSYLDIKGNAPAYYKEIIMSKDIPLLSIECGQIVKDNNSSSALLKIKRINGHTIVVKDHDTFRDGSTTEITDINGDGLQDIKITLEENSEIRLENGRPVAILGGFLTLEPAENGKILVSKRNVPIEEDNLNIKVQYGTELSFTEPVKEIPITIKNSSISSFNVYYNRDITTFSFLLKQLKKLPGGENGIKGNIYGMYDLSLYPTDPGTIYIEFLVEEQWLKYRELKFEDVHIAHLKDGKWSYTAPSKIGDQEENIIFSVNLKDPGIFCILGLPNTSEKYRMDPETISSILRSISEDINEGDRGLEKGSVEKLSSKAIGTNVPVYIMLFLFIVCIAILLVYANKDTFAEDRTRKVQKEEKYIKAIEFNRRLCLTLVAIFLLLLIAEEIWQGSISSHLNTNIILICVIITGSIDIVGRRFWKKEGL